MKDTITAARTQANERRSLRGVHCRLVKECEYVYRNRDGQVAFVKVRYRWIHTSTCNGKGSCRGRDKSFGYYYFAPNSGRKIKQKPPEANGLLYHMEMIEPALARGSTAPIYFCEGEKDADAVIAVGGMATSAHQGAGKVTMEQVRWLYNGPGEGHGLHWSGRPYNATHIILCADRDSAGAYDVLLRAELLQEAGFNGRLDIVRAKTGKDVADHLEAGHSLAELVPVDISRLRAAAVRYKADLEANTARYMDGGNDAA